MNQISGMNLDFPREYLKAALLVSLLSVWVLVGLFYYLNRYTRRRYFTIWTAAWLFYAVWLTLGMSTQATAEQPLVLMFKQWCLSATAVLLLWGSARFLGVRTRQMSFGLFTAFLFVWSFVGAYHLGDSLQSHVPIFGLIGGASLMTGSCFYKFRREQEYVGAGLLSFGFTLWGFYLASYPFIQNSENLISAGFFMSAVLQLFIAVSMIVLVLEEVRHFNQTVREKIRTTEWENHALQTRVESTEERYRGLFEQAVEGIIITDAAQFRILELNPAAARLLGLDRAEAIGKELTDLCRWAAKVPAKPYTRAEWFDLVCGRQLNVVRRDGGTTLVEISGSRIQFDGQPGCQFYVREVTERVRLAKQLRQAEKLSALGRMISGVAHELNNPLAVVKGYTELILATHELAPGTRADLEKVAHEGDRAARLVSNFLSFARESKTSRRQVDLNELVRQTAGRHEFNLKASRIDLQLELDPHLPKTVVNPDQVEQVLVNLMSNAQQAMAGSRQVRCVRLSTQRKGELVRLTVEDSGPGVPDNLESRIFEPFFTTKEVGKGTGLGLSIAHGIMADHHGRIYYRRSVLGGAAFVLEFPLVEVNGEVKRAPDTDFIVKAHKEKVPASAARILVVDDERPLAEMLGEVLTMLGHRPTVCFHPCEALEQLAKESYDLVLSDFKMPVLTGEEFYRKVAERWPQLAGRIIFLTGDMVSDKTREFLASVGNPHLAKPFNLANVEEVVGRTLKGCGAKV